MYAPTPKNSRTAEALQQNLTSLEYSFPVLTSPVENWLPQAKDQYDLIFLDPPYDQTGAELSHWKVIQGLERLLAPSGRIIWEHHTSSVWSPHEPLREVWCRTYGRSTVTFLAASDAR
jgi:16S rRNA G966 N2-methylase RsmD